MKKRGLVALLVIILALLASFFNSACFTADQIMGVKKLAPYTGFRYAPHEIIVKFRLGVSAEEMREVNSRYGTMIKNVGLIPSLCRLRITGRSTVEEMVREYNRHSAVEYAEPNYIAHAFMVPDDPYYQYQWHMDNAEYRGIGMEQAWDIQMGDPGIIVAVIDTGVAYENYTSSWWWWERNYYQAPDLVNTTFVKGYDFVEKDEHPNDDNSHGTHVTGTIAQSTNNSIGCVGVAFNTAIMPVKVLDRNGTGYYFDIANGIIWATDNGAHIINLSLGGSTPSTVLEDAVAYAYSKGVIVIAAAGNDGSSQVSYPAAYNDYVIAVGATRYDEILASYSNYGSSLDLVAPGGDLSVDQNGDGYGDGVLQNTFNPNTGRTDDFGYWFFEGTSMAAPHVSALTALIIAEGVATTPDEVRTVLQETTEDLGDPGRDNTYGHGLVDAYTALNWTSTSDTTPPVISEVTTTDIMSDSATVTWLTDESSDSVVNYGTTSALGNTTFDAAMIRTHSVILTGLTPGTTYYYEVESTDAAGNTATDNNNGQYYTLTTLALDTEAPKITESMGDTNGTTGEPISVSATITDNMDVVSATVHYTPIGGVETTVSMTEGADSLWNANVPVASDKVGTITYYITAKDMAGNTGRDPATETYGITVTDNDAPVAEVGPDQSVLVNEEVIFDGSGSSDNIGITSYSWDFDDNDGIQEDAKSSPYFSVNYLQDKENIPEEKY